MAGDRDTPEAEDLKGLLAALVEQFRALAARVSGDPDRASPCHFCGEPLPLWESLLVLQLTGVSAHVECPLEALERRLREVGPAPEFAYEDFCAAVERRLLGEPPTACSGMIEEGGVPPAG